jgi:MFS family permease
VSTAAPDRPARGDLRHNLLALGADYALFHVGFSFASQSTVLPAFARELGAPNLVIGAIPAVMTLGWFLPSLFAAGHTEALAAKLPFVLRWSLWERVPMLVLALAAFLIADAAPGATLLLMLGMLLATTGVGGILVPAWMDIVGRAIPTHLRGRFFGVSNVVAGAGGLLGSAGTTYVLASLPAPRSYGVCFLAAAACFGASYAALTVVREPPGGRPAPAVPMSRYLGRIPGVLRRDANLAWFLVARAIGVVGTMGSGFLTVYALGTLGAPSWQVGVFTILLLAGHVAGNLALGWLADRAGHRLVVMLGMLAMMAANIVALVARSTDGLGAAFVLVGLHQAAVHVSHLNIFLEFAPADEERPTYIGLGSTSVAPFAFASPLLAGLAADTLGLRVVFWVATAFGLAALLVLWARVGDPRPARLDGRRSAG